MGSEGQLIDPYNGQQDLKYKILRHTTEAFAEDPVRVLRVARFLARFGPEWSIHPSTVALMKSMYQAGELKHLVAERVWKEMEKALMEPYPRLFFETLIEYDLFPELQAMQCVPQPKQHHPEGDVFIHTMLVVQRAADLKFDLMTRFAALTHDFGKPLAYQQQGNLHGHEALGMPIIEAFCERLRVPNKLKKIGILMSENHTKCHKIKELKPATLHRFIVEKMNALKQPERFVQFVNACICDSQGRGPTMVDRAYPQAQIALNYLAALEAMDNKDIISEAISQGKSGVELGEHLRIAQISCLRNTYLS
jgi:tRNA nucleotidyltransferase (CCA-adding enzyme)